jgi:GDPmannose 4,6-dehydratase
MCLPGRAGNHPKRLNMKTALIMGITGQDGAFLARFLLDKGYRVFGTSRRGPDNRFDNLVHLDILGRVSLVAVDPVDPGAVRRVVQDLAPDEVYNLAAQSSVARSFDMPEATFDSIVTATRVLLEAVRDLALPGRIFSAGSGDCFGDLTGRTADETTPFNPQSPYAQAKVEAFGLVDTFRRRNGVFACTGILFNHESLLRPPAFVTRKIVDAALEIAGGRSRELVLGNLSICRDWGWAPEYVDAMWRMLQADVPEDYVIATGTSIQLADFVEAVFTHLGLDWKTHVRTDPRFFRASDIATLAADPSRAYRQLGWKTRYTGTEVPRLMIEAARAARAGNDTRTTGTHT